MEEAIQDLYVDDFSHCYGCGRLNAEGLQLKTYWEGDETRATFHPRPYHTAIPGYVYGGLIASLIDCHGTGTAAAAAMRAAGISMSRETTLRFLTASLQVDYLRPTPLGVPLELRGTILEIKGRKVTVGVTLSAEGVITATGKVIAVQAPEDLLTRIQGD